MAAMDFTLKNEDGSESVVDDGHVVNELKRMGHDVRAVSSDGQTLTIAQPGVKEPIQVPTVNALQALGHQVSHALPANSDKTAIHPSWGAELQSLPEVPEARKAFLEAKLRSAGIENPQVIGHGDEYHVYDPDQSKWHQVTEAPGMNQTGILSAGLALPHLVGMGVGGTMGAAAGGTLGGLASGGAGSAPGAFVGGSLGAGVGSAVGEAGRQALLSALDSDYAKTAGDHLTEEAWNAAKTGAYDGIAHGAAGLVGKVLPKDLISKAVGTAGRAVEGLGGLTRRAAGALADSDVASSLATDFTPYVGQASMLGQIMQAPQAAVSGLAKAAAALPESKVFSPLFGDELSAKIGDYGRSILQRNAPQGFREGLNDIASNAASKLGAEEAPQVTAKAADVFENMAKRRAAAAKYADPANEWSGIENEAAHQAYRTGTMSGATEEEMARLAEAAKQGVRADATKAYMNGERAPLARSVGRMVDGLAAAGTGLENSAVKTGKAGLRTLQALGTAGEFGGNAVANAATVAAPLELPTLMRYGVPKIKNWWEDEKRARGPSWP